jgi:hypothetical protein
MKILIPILFSLLSLHTYGQWTNLNSNISDNLNDIHFRDASNGVVAGNRGVYYTTSGGTSWTRFTPTNPTDLATYNRCKFVKIAADPGTAKTYICGTDTVNAKAVMFYYKSDDQSCSFVYTGAVNTAFYNAVYVSNEVFAVGSAGLLVRYTTITGTSFTYPAVTSKNLRSVAINGVSTSTTILGGDSVLVNLNINGNSILNSQVENLNYVFTDLMIESQTFYAITPLGFYRSTLSNISSLTEITSYKFGPLHPTRMYKSTPLNEFYVTTDHGVFKRVNGPLELQPSSMLYNLKGISFPYSSTTAYACGNNGVVLKTTSSGGPGIPYVNAFLTTGCKNDFITIQKENGGSGTSCLLACFNTSNVQVGPTINTGCSSNQSNSWNFSGDFTFRFIVSNGTYSDTVYFTRTIPEPPVINLATTVSDTLLCKNEQVSVNVANTSTGWDYALMKQGSANPYGGAPGNGGNLAFTSSFVSDSGTFYIKVSGQNNGCTRNFTNTIPIKVEKTKSRMVSQYINAFVNEPVYFNAVSNDANFYKWTFDNSASSTVVTGKTVQVSFNSTGTKNVELISWTSNGCYDTAGLKATTIVNESGLPDDCYHINISGTEATWNGYDGSKLLQDINVVNDGIVISGGDHLYALKSNVGDSLPTTDYGGALVVKYSKKGTLRWRIYSKFANYNCPPCNGQYTRPGVLETIAMPDGSNVMAGLEYPNSWMYFNNGDSIQIVGTAISLLPNARSFVTKVNSSGQVPWNGYFIGAEITAFKQDKFGNFWVGATTTHQTYYHINGHIDTLMNTAAGGTAVTNMLIKLDPSGNFISATHNATNGYINIPDAIIDLQPDANGDIWTVARYVDGKLYNSNGSLAVTLPKPSGQGVYDGTYIAKYDNNGNYLFHLSSRAFTYNTNVRPTHIALDSSNNLYIHGLSYAAMAADSIQWLHSNSTRTTMLTGSFYLMKLNPQGVIQWINGSKLGYYGSDAHSMTITKDRIYITNGIGYTGPNVPQYWSGYLTSTDGNTYGINNLSASAFLVLGYDYSGKLLQVANSNSTISGQFNINRIVKDQNRIYISGGTFSSVPYPAFNQVVVPRDSREGVFMVLNGDFCYAPQAATANAGVDKTVCSGEATTIGTSTLTGNSYSWTSFPLGFTSDSSAAIVAPNVTTTYYLSVINASGAVAKDTVTLFVGGAIADAGPHQQICGTGSVNIGTPSVAGTNYVWTSSPAGFNSTASTLTVSPPSTTTYYLQATNGGSCIGKDTVKITVSPLPLADAGPDKFICAGMSTTLGTPSTPFTTYLWTPAVMYNPSAEVSQPIVAPTTTTSYILRVAFNETGCRKYDTVLVTVGTLAATGITPSGNVTICGFNSVTLSATYNWNVYQWMRDGIAISGATGPSLTTTTPASYTVKLVGTGCEGPASSPVVVSVGSVPSPPTISGSSFYCAGSSTTLTSSSPAGNQWYLNGVAILSATAQTYVASQVGNYSIRATMNGCISSFSLPFALTVTPLPATPIISQNGNTLGSTATSGNQWYKDGVLIPGATGVYYSPTASGVYTVVTTVNGCSSSSNPFPFTYLPTAITDPVLDGMVSLYPNPVKDELHINNNSTHQLECTLISGVGKELLKLESKQNNLIIPTRFMAAGVYYLKIRDKRTGRLAVKKLLKAE